MEKEKIDKPRIRIKLEEAKNLPKYIRKDLGIDSGLVIKEIASSSPAKIDRYLPSNNSYMSELDESLNSLDRSSIVGKLKSYL